MTTASPAVFIRDRFTWLSYFLLGYFAYLEAVLAPAMPFLKDELDLNYWMGGLHLSVVALGVTLNGMVADRIIRRWGRRAVFWAGGGGMAVGVTLVALGPSVLITIPGAFIMGAWGGFVLVTIQAALSDQHGSYRTVAITEANMVAASTTMFAPLLVGNLERLGLGWRGALYLPAILWAVLALSFWRIPVPEAEREDDDNRAVLRRKLPPVFWAYMCGVLLLVALEWCISLWTSDFLHTVVGLSKENASSLLSVFFIAMVIGRYTGSRLARTMRSESLIYGAIVLTAVGFPLFWLPRAAPLNITGLFLCGLGIANFYPIGLSLAVGVVPQQANAASARMSVGVGAAIMALPQLLSALADAVGLRAAYGLVIVILALGAAVMVFANRLAVRHNTALIDD